MSRTATPHGRRIPPAIWIFLFVFAVRLLVVIVLSKSLHFLPDGDDMKFYSDWALRIAGGQWTDGQAFYGLPGYAYCLALVFSVVGGFDPFVVGALQAALDAGVAVLLWRLAHEIFAPAPAEAPTSAPARAPVFIGLGAVLVWTFFTPAQAFSAVMMPTIWLVFAYYVCVWFAVTTRTASWWRPWLGLGLFAGLVAMLVATILFAVPLLVVAIFRSVAPGQPWPHRAPRIAGALAVLVAGLFVGASPAWLHNHFIAREPVMLSAHSGINFWIGNNPVATGYPKMPPGIRATQDGLLRDSITLAEAGAGRRLTRAEVSKYWSAKANAYIADNRSAWLRLMAAKLGNFWNAYQYDDLSIIKLLRDDHVLPPGLKFGFIAALGLAGALPTLLRFPRGLWLAAAVLLHLCALLPVFVTERYRLAAAPALLLLGAAGLWVFAENIARHRWAHAAGYLALCAVAAWFVSMPRGDIGLWSLDHYKAGIRATTAGDLDRAQRNLETAYAYVPNNADICFALGNVSLARSSVSETAESAKAAHRVQAKLFYRRALDLNPRHSGTHNNLGVLAMEEKRWPLAEQFLLASLEAETAQPKTHYLLARVYFESGRFDAARASLEKALRIRPNQKEFLSLREKIAASERAK